MQTWQQCLHFWILIHCVSLADRQAIISVPSVLRRCWLGVRKGIRLIKNMGDGGGGHWLVWMEWRPAGWSVCLPLLIFPCTIKSKSSLLAPAHPCGPGKRAVKPLWWCVLCLKKGYHPTTDNNFNNSCRFPVIFGQPFVKRFAVCYWTVVLSCLSVLSLCLSVTLVCCHYCGQTLGQIKMKLGMQVCLGTSHIVLDGDPAPPPPKRGTASPILGPCPLWPNGWMDSVATRYGGRPWPK